MNFICQSCQDQYHIMCSNRWTKDATGALVERETEITTQCACQHREGARRK